MKRSDSTELPSYSTTKLHLQLVDVNAASGPAGVLYSGTEVMRSTETCRRYAETSNYGLTASMAMKSPSFTTRVLHSLGRDECSYNFKRHFRRRQQFDLCFQNFPVGQDQQNSHCLPNPALVLRDSPHLDGNEASNVFRSRNPNKYPETIRLHYKRHVLSTKRSGRTGAICKPHRGTKSITIADALHGQLGHLTQPTRSHV
jgi:hypothetical protein